jgi:nucleotide-binding universal stress UspA family protein
MYSSILVPIDLDEPSSWRKAIPTALAIGTCFSASVALVHVVSDVLLAAEAEWSGLALRRILDTACARLGLLADELKTDADIEVHVATGRVYRGVLDIAEQVHADLIVMASHRPEMKDFLIGENAERVVRHARCSVLVVRE